MNAAFAYAQRDVRTIAQVMPFVTDTSACIQAGACLGVFPKHLANLFGAVYSFEPDPELFRKAVIHAGEHNVRWFNAALGVRRDMVKTECRRRDGSTRPTHAGLTFTSLGGITPTLRVDDFGLPTLGLLQLDVEGGELAALQGARDTIARCRPVIMVEVNKQVTHSGITEDDLRAHVLGLNYTFRFRSNSDEVYTPC